MRIFLYFLCVSEQKTLPLANQGMSLHEWQTNLSTGISTLFDRVQRGNVR